MQIYLCYLDILSFHLIGMSYTRMFTQVMIILDTQNHQILMLSLSHLNLQHFYIELVRSIITFSKEFINFINHGANGLTDYSLYAYVCAWLHKHQFISMLNSFRIMSQILLNTMIPETCFMCPNNTKC